MHLFYSSPFPVLREPGSLDCFVRMRLDDWKWLVKVGSLMNGRFVVGKRVDVLQFFGVTGCTLFAREVVNLKL